MRFVVINNLMQSSRRLRHRLLSNLQPPPADAPLPRKDHTGFIFILLGDRKSTRLNSSHEWISRMPSSA